MFGEIDVTLVSCISRPMAKNAQSPRGLLMGDTALGDRVPQRET